MMNGFGHLRDLKITTNDANRTKDVIMTIELTGEPEPIQIFVSGAKLIRRGEQRFLFLETISTPTSNKVWVNLLLEKFKLLPMEFPLSPSVASQAGLVLFEENQG
jgi:hypothetical protein